MPLIIQAQSHVGIHDLPSNAGKKLAEVVCDFMFRPGCLGECIIDVTKVSPSILISGFFLSFVQRCYELYPDRMEKIRKLEWHTEWGFQKQSVKKWMEYPIESIAQLCEMPENTVTYPELPQGVATWIGMRIDAFFMFLARPLVRFWLRAFSRSSENGTQSSGPL